jgi:predicted aspartyl protease
MIPLASRPRVYPRLKRFMGQGVQPSSGDPARDLLVNGAIMQVQVSVPGAGGGGQTFTAMIDTGASISCINISLAQQLGLQQVSSTLLGGVGGQMESPIYAAALHVPQFNVTVDPIQIAGVQNPLPGVDMLIGRDVLASLHLEYHGGSGSFTLENETPPPTTQNQVAANPATPGTVAPPGAPAQNLPQPPAETTILGMKPLVAAGVGVAGVGLVVGALFLFDVL